MEIGFQKILSVDEDIKAKLKKKKKTIIINYCWVGNLDQSLEERFKEINRLLFKTQFIITYQRRQLAIFLCGARIGFNRSSLVITFDPFCGVLS